MKRLAVCLVFILVFVGALAAFADTSTMIGETVDQVYPVYVNGQQLSVEAISINGTSYLPTRAVSEALGATVTFQDGQIDVTTSGVSNTVSNTTQTTDGNWGAGQVTAHFEDAILGIPDTLTAAYELNGQWYVKAGAFGNYMDVSTNQVTIPGRGTSLIDTPSNPFGFMINISDFGFTATLNGNILDIQ